MLQPTDRVLAKTFVRILVDTIKGLAPDNASAVQLLTLVTINGAKGNSELLTALKDLVHEAADEADAERTGAATPNVYPYPLNAPQPEAHNGPTEGPFSTARHENWD
jgi:hypothetical protein